MIYWASSVFLAATPSILPNETQAEITVAGMQSFLGLYAAAIGAAFSIALITSGIVYLLRPIIGRFIQAGTLRLWARRNGKGGTLVIPDWLVAAAKANQLAETDQKAAEVRDRFAQAGASEERSQQTLGLVTKPGQLRDELFMHGVQLEAKAAAKRPSINPRLFLAVTRDAPWDARGTVAFFDLIAREHPEVAAKMATFEPGASGGDSETAPSPNPTAAAIQAAEATLSAAADRSLDRLQLSLMTMAIWPYRILALAVGALLAWFGMLALDLGDAWIYVPVGIAGGVLSLFLSDALAFITRRLAR